jgi:hypothetical protein
MPYTLQRPQWPAASAGAGSSLPPISTPHRQTEARPGGHHHIATPKKTIDDSMAKELSRLTCPVCGLPCLTPSNSSWDKYDCMRCGEFILTGPLQAELPGKLSGGIHRRALMSHKLRRMGRDGQPPKISTYTVDSFWTDEVMPTPAEQADNLILWVGCPVETGASSNLRGTRGG